MKKETPFDWDNGRTENFFVLRNAEDKDCTVYQHVHVLHFYWSEEEKNITELILNL